MFSAASVPVCLSVCNALTFECLGLSLFLVRTHVRLQNIQDTFIYQGHRIEVKVTGAKSVPVPCSRVVCLLLKGDLLFH